VTTRSVDATCTHFAGCFDVHRDVAVIYGAHCLMEEIHGFHKKPLNTTIGRALAPILVVNRNFQVHVMGLFSRLLGECMCPP